MKNYDCNELRICCILIDALKNVNNDMWTPNGELMHKYRPILTQIVNMIGIETVSSVVGTLDGKYILLRENFDLFLIIVESYLDKVPIIDFKRAFKSLESLAILVDRTDFIVKTNREGIKLSESFCILLDETIARTDLSIELEVLYSSNSRIKAWVNDKVLINKLTVLEDIIRAKSNNWEKFGFDSIEGLGDLANDEKYMSLANFVKREIKMCKD